MKRLEFAHYLAISLLAEGRMTNADIAERCGITRQTLYNWRQDALFIAELERWKRRLEDG